jgi:hypothetical protein
MQGGLKLLKYLYVKGLMQAFGQDGANPRYSAEYVARFGHTAQPLEVGPASGTDQLCKTAGDAWTNSGNLG